MTPAARLQMAIEILEGLEQTAQPFDRFIQGWFRSRRFAGSKDRRAIAERVFSIARRRAHLAHRMASDSPRALAIASLLDEGADIGALFAGGYGPAPLTKDELAAIAASPSPEPVWVQGEYPPWLEEQLKRAESDWKSRWTVAVASLGKSDDVSTAEVGALLEIYEELRGLLAELDDVCHRVEGMEQDAAVFDESVRRVSRIVGFDSTDQSAIDASVKLDAELASAEKAAGRIAELDALVQRVEMQLKNAERQRSLQILAVERLPI